MSASIHIQQAVVQPLDSINHNEPNDISSTNKYILYYAQLCATSYRYCLLSSIFIQLTTMTLCVIIDPHVMQYTYNHIPGVMVLVLVLSYLAQFILTICATVHMIHELTELTVTPLQICYMYITICIMYSQLYYICFLLDSSAFVLDGFEYSDIVDVNTVDYRLGYSDTRTINDLPSIMCYFIYFSGSIMTSTGFGDIVPRVWYTQLMVNTQQLIGTLYHTGVFGITVQHFRTYKKIKLQIYQDTIHNHSMVAAEQHSNELNHSSSKPSTWYQSMILLSHRINQWCTDYVLLFNLLVQSSTICLLSTVHDSFQSDNTANSTSKTIVVILVILIQFILFVHLLYISIVLVNQVSAASVSIAFLLQSFISTALLYAGIYLSLYTATPSHQFYRTNSLNTNTLHEVIFVFIHFSCTVLTSTGFGDVYARGVISRLVVLSEMWVCILYTCVIIGLGCANMIEHQTAQQQYNDDTHINHTQSNNIIDQLSESDDHSILYNSTPTPAVYNNSSSISSNNDSNKNTTQYMDIDTSDDINEYQSLNEFIGTTDSDDRMDQ